MPTGWLAWYYRVSNATPQMLALMVYLRIKEILEKKKGTEEYVSFLKTKFDAALASLESTGRHILKALLGGAIGYKVKQLKLIMNAKYAAVIRTAWDKGTESLPEKVKLGEAYNEASKYFF